MMGRDEQSDNELVSAARDGDRSAYAELWQRHSRAAIAVARSYSSFDADDIVAEAFANIYTVIGRGGGPTTGFRPYLFTTVRNVAATWGRAANTLNVEDIETIGDISNEADTLDRLEKTLTVTAFRSLPDPWQEVLWYSEVEALTPRQIGPLMGLTPNSVSALALRAREGLRVAWVKAHLSSTSTDPECRWTIEKLPAWSRGRLSQRMTKRVDAHLEWCVDCRAAADEAAHISDRLAVVLLPLAAGVAGAAAYTRLGGARASRPTVAMAVGGGASGSGAGVAVVGGLVAASIVTAAILSFSPGSGSALPVPERVQTTRPAPTEVTPVVPGSVPAAPSASGTLAPTGRPDADTDPDARAASPASDSRAEPVDGAPRQDENVQAPALDAPGMVSSKRPVTVYPEVHGVAVGRAEVSISAEGGSGEWTVTADSDGTWAAELTGLAPGVWTVTAAQIVTDASGTRRSPLSTGVTVELAEAPRAIYGDVIASPQDGSLWGAPNASVAYSIVLGSGQVGSGQVVLDDVGCGWLPIPRDDEVESITVFYVVGDWIGPTRTIVPPFR